MHTLRQTLGLSRGFRDRECDVVSNSQLKVDISTRERPYRALGSARLPSPPRSVHPPLSPLPRLDCPSSPDLLAPRRSACSPNINSCRLCGIRNFPTVFSAQRRSIRAPNLRHHRETLSPPLSLLSLISSSPLLRRRPPAPRSFRPFHYETNQCFSLEKGSKRNSCVPHSPLSLPLSSLSAAQYMRNRAGVCLSARL